MCGGAVTCSSKRQNTVALSTVDKVENEVDGLYVTLKNQHKTNTYFLLSHYCFNFNFFSFNNLSTSFPNFSFQLL
jgi:hypothetical protein